MSTVLKVLKCHENAKMPEHGSVDSVGFDLFCVEPFNLAPGERLAVPTGLKFEIPPHLWMKVEARSGLAAKQGIIVGCGVVDPDYRGEVKVVLINTGTKNFAAAAGDKIAQAVFHSVHVPVMLEVSSINETARGEGGFGSSDKPPVDRSGFLEPKPEPVAEAEKPSAETQGEPSKS